MTPKIGFNDTYKGWRNRARRLSALSIIRIAMQVLQKPAANRLEDMQQAPWQILLLVRWVCQDRMLDRALGEPISENLSDENGSKV